MSGHEPGTLQRNSGLPADRLVSRTDGVVCCDWWDEGVLSCDWWDEGVLGADWLKGEVSGGEWEVWGCSFVVRRD